MAAKEDIPSILKNGFVSTGEGRYQSYKSAHKGAYGYAGTRLGLSAAKEMVRQANETSDMEDGFGIVRISVPISLFGTRLRPDEDWSQNQHDWVRYKDEGSGVILGNIPPKYIKEIKT